MEIDLKGENLKSEIQSMFRFLLDVAEYEGQSDDFMRSFVQKIIGAFDQKSNNVVVNVTGFKDFTKEHIYTLSPAFTRENICKLEKERRRYLCLLSQEKNARTQSQIQNLIESTNIKLKHEGKELLKRELESKL